MRQVSKTAVGALVIVAGPVAGFAQTPAPDAKPANCPPGYESLCAALQKPSAHGGLGSAVGTGAKATVNTNKDVQTPTLDNGKANPGSDTAKPQ